MRIDFKYPPPFKRTLYSLYEKLSSLYVAGKQYFLFKNGRMIDLQLESDRTHK